MPTIAECLRDVIVEYAAAHGLSSRDVYIYIGQVDILHAAYQRARGRNHRHPVDILQTVVAAAARSPMFEPAGRIRCVGTGVSGREHPHRAYRLRLELEKETAQ